MLRSAFSKSDNEYIVSYYLFINIEFIDVFYIDDYLFISIDNNNTDLLNSVQLFDTELKISPISYGVRDIIRQWEIDNSKSLKREGPVIVLKMSGSLSNPTIIGVD